MKNLILSSLMSLALLSVTAQDQPGQMPQATPAVTTNPEFVQFKEISHDFGNVKQNAPPSYTFEFKNVGTKDINLVNVAASCGCTTPNWKGGIYKPGETGQITATFNAASEGFFSKNITVTSSEGVVVLTITGTVLAPAAYDEWKAKKDADDAQKAKEDASKKPVKKSGKHPKKANTEGDKPKSSDKKKQS